MASPQPALDVYQGHELVGTVFDGLPTRFAYAPTWLARSEAMSLGTIPLSAEVQSGLAIQAFFENLLPEGEMRQYLATQRQASSLFALLREVAGDTIGSCVLVPAGTKPRPARYEATTWEALATRLRSGSAAAIDLTDDARISLSGAQDKTSIAIFDDGVPRLPKGTSPSTHIVKPDIRRLAQVWHSAANEAIVMRTAALAGLPTAEVFYEPHTGCCVVRRFDRFQRADGSLARRVQYDLCQLAEVVSDHKYEKEGGPGLVRCAELIRRYSAQPALDLRHLVRWLVFNLYVGNNDSHAKNLSLLHTEGDGVRLAPFYDLMCTRLYPGLSQAFAFSVGGEFLPGAMSSRHLAALAGELSMRPTYVAQLAAEMAVALPPALAQAIDELRPSLPPSARTMALRLEQYVRSTTKKTARRLTA